MSPQSLSVSAKHTFLNNCTHQLFQVSNSVKLIVIRILTTEDFTVVDGHMDMMAIYHIQQEYLYYPKRTSA